MKPFEDTIYIDSVSLIEYESGTDGFLDSISINSIVQCDCENILVVRRHLSDMEDTVFLVLANLVLSQNLIY